jgi:hypothetical protein
MLDALERAWEAGVVLGVPLPSSFDAYVSSGASHSAISDRDSIRHYDYARAFSVLDARVPAGCSRDFDAARELYAASALSVAPAIDDGSLRAESAALAHLAVPCASVDVSAFQSRADLALADPDVNAAPFFSWVDDGFGKEPGHALAATWALAPTKTIGDEHFSAEPDVFDVLRESLKGASGPGSTFEDAIAAFSVDRLSLTSPVRFDWDITWPKSARALASPLPISPTGATYVRIDAASRRAGARLRVDASWEEHAKMRWSVVKLDAHGAALAQWEAKAAPKATEAHVQIVDTDGAASFVIVGANVGYWLTPFDPDESPWEPHGWLLTVAEE